MPSVIHTEGLTKPYGKRRGVAAPGDVCPYRAGTRTCAQVRTGPSALPRNPRTEDAGLGFLLPDNPPAGGNRETDIVATYKDGILEIRLPVATEKPEPSRVPATRL